MESLNSSLFMNGGSNNSNRVSFLSLLMEDDEDNTLMNVTQQQHQQKQHCYNDDEVHLPPLPPSFEPEPSSFVNNPCHVSLPGLCSLEGDFHSQESHPSYNEGCTLETVLEEYMKSSLKNKNKKKKAEKKKTTTFSERVYMLGKMVPISGGDGGGSHSNSSRRRGVGRTTAEVLEGAHKYIRFLQAQVSALRSMPVLEARVRGAGIGGGRLSRQKVLEVVVNSPVAQAVMADNGWCLVAAEQVALVERIEARKRLVHRLLADIPI